MFIIPILFPGTQCMICWTYIWLMCMVNVGESPYIEHLRLKSSGSSGGSKPFWASIFAIYFVGRKTTISQPFPLQLATFRGHKGTSCSRGEIIPVTTHAIYRWNHSISKNDGAHLVLSLMEEILVRKRCEKPVPSTDFKSTKPYTRLFVEEKHLIDDLLRIHVLFRPM